jgi:RNA polymerase sigma-70 factor (ECF subfamily)
MPPDLDKPWPADDEFPSTHWTLLRELGDRSSPRFDAALAWLCQAYWAPIYAYIRRRGCSPHEACDVTQAFFTSLLERKGFPPLDPGRGRFRAYLLACCKHFLANTRARAAAFKRGGDRKHFAIDPGSAEQRYLAEPIDHLTADDAFDRLWILSLLNHVAAELRDEYERKGNLPLFEHLQSSLFDEADALPHAEVAQTLGLSVDAVKKAAQRLRERYRDLIRNHVARTVEDPAQVQEEIRDLFAALQRGRSSRPC